MGAGLAGDKPDHMRVEKTPEMIFENSGVSPEQFLADYWQKKPLLIRQALPGFTPELDSDDIAGLACDELAESRLITGSFPKHDWRIRYGPFRRKGLQTTSRDRLDAFGAGRRETLPAAAKPDEPVQLPAPLAD